MPVTLPKRYIRNCSALSESDCVELSRAHVAVVGCGGLGGSVIESLARVGVGSLRLIDGDVFEESNLNRQILCTEADLKRKKVRVAAERVRAINSSVSVETLDVFVGEKYAARFLSDTDCVVDCLDSLPARFWTARACQELGIPVVYGSVAGWFGQVCTVFPGDPSFASIYGTIEGKSLHKELGTLPFAASAVAAVQAAEVVKVLLHRPSLLRNRLLMIDLLDGSMEDVELQ